jgi:4-amino-4-deoxy-L-arabinose transferase-like glycosyltransferase
MKLKSNTRHLVQLALLGVLVLHVAVNAWWLARDQHPVHGPEADHVSQSLLMHGVLTSPAVGSMTDRLWLAGQVEGIQPPLLSIAGAATAAVAGVTIDSIVAGNTFFFLLLILGTALLAGTLVQRGKIQAAIIAAAAVGFTPILAGASRLMVPEMGTAAMLLLFLWALLRAEAFRWEHGSLAAALFAGLGLLSDLSFALWLAAPVLAAGILACRCQAKPAPPEARAPRLTHLVLFVLVAFSVSATWYYHSAQSLLEGDKRPLRDLPATYLALGNYAPPETFAIQPAMPAPDLPGEIQAEAALVAPMKPRAQPMPEKPARTSGWSPYGAFILSAGLLPTLCLAIAGGLLLILSRRGAAVLLVVTVLAGSLFLGFTATARPEHLLPLVPLLVILATAALLAVPWRWPRRALIALYLAFLALQYANVTIAPLAGDTALAPAALFRHSALAMGPPWREGNLYETVYGAVEKGAGDARFVTMQPINASGFRVLARSYWPPTDTPGAVVVPLEPEYISEPEQLDGLDLRADFFVIALREGSGEELPPRWKDALERARAEILDLFAVPAFGDLPEARLVVFRLPPTEHASDDIIQSM